MLEQMKTGWVGQAESAAADISFDYFIMYGLGFLAASIFVCWCLIIQLQLYQMCPGWGPIRKFDNDGTEEMRINQLLIHEEKMGVGHRLAGDKSGGDENLKFLTGMWGQAQGEMTGLVNKAADSAGLDTIETGEGGRPADPKHSGFQESYGAIGPCTWGYCESPNQWGEPQVRYPYGEVTVRHGFADTQWMRGHCKSWARDEPYFQNVNGIIAAPPSLAEESASVISHRMVIDRNGY